MKFRSQLQGASELFVNFALFHGMSSCVIEKNSVKYIDMQGNYNASLS